MENQIEITEENFEEHFFDTRKFKAQKGQVLATFTAIAQFIEGKGKLDIMRLIMQGRGVEAATIMRKIHGAKEPECYRLVREIAEDLLRMKFKEVEQKPYEYIVQYSFWTKKEFVPKNKHWEILKIMQYDKESGEYKSQIEI